MNRGRISPNGRVYIMYWYAFSLIAGGFFRHGVMQTILLDSISTCPAKDEEGQPIYILACKHDKLRIKDWLRLPNYKDRIKIRIIAGPPARELEKWLYYRSQFPDWANSPLLFPGYSQALAREIIKRIANLKGWDPKLSWVPYGLRHGAIAQFAELFERQAASLVGFKAGHAPGSQAQQIYYWADRRQEDWRSVPTQKAPEVSLLPPAPLVPQRPTQSGPAKVPVPPAVPQLVRQSFPGLSKTSTQAPPSVGGARPPVPPSWPKAQRNTNLTPQGPLRIHPSLMVMGSSTGRRNK
jgi:hypothetical protein